MLAPLLRPSALVPVCLWFLSLSGCSSSASWPKVLDPSDIVDISEGTPRIRQVRDLGNVHIGQAGPLPGESDGQFTVGELVLVEGSGFGKQPTLSIAGRPGELLWRTQGGGIIFRLPTAVPSGSQVLVVQAGGKRAEAPLVVRRLGLILDARRGQLHVVDLRGGPGTPPALRTVGQPLSLPGAQHLALSSDGAMAYVLLSAGDRQQVAIVDLGAPGGPRLADTREITHRAYALQAAERAPVLAVVGEEHVTVWDTREARRPAPYPAARLPGEARGARAAALDPTGTLIALAVPEGNRAVLLDVKPGVKGVHPELVAQVEVLPPALARQPLLSDLRFSSDGETLWLLSGDNQLSRAAGHQPTRLSAVRVGASEASTEIGRTQRELAVDRTADLPDAGAPVRLGLGRTPPVASGATIRTPPDKALLYFTAVAPEALAGGKDAAGGSLLRGDLGGASAVVHSGSELLGGLDLSPDAVLVLAASAAPGRQGLGVVLVHTESGAAISLPLGTADAGHLRPPFSATEVAVQP